MAILSGFKSFERYLKVPTDNGNKYQLMSERTLAKDVIFDSDENKNLETKMQEVNDKFGGIKFNPPLTQEEYDALETKDENTIYFIKGE